MFQNYKKFQVKSKQQAKYSASNFSFDGMKKLISNILEANIPEFPKQMDLNIPTLKKKYGNIPKLTLPTLKKPN